MEQVDQSEAEFPRVYIENKSGIEYVEHGPDIVMVHLVRVNEDEIGLVISSGESELSNVFMACTHGTVIKSLTLIDLFHYLD